MRSWIGVLVVGGFVLGPVETSRADGTVFSLFEDARRTPAGISFHRAAPPPTAFDPVKTAETSDREPEGTLTLRFGDAFQPPLPEDRQIARLGGEMADEDGDPLSVNRVGVVTRQGRDGVGLSSAFMVAPKGERVAASELAIDTGMASLQLHGGYHAYGDDPEREEADGAFGGAALEASSGEVGYALRWHGSIDGSTGSLALRRGETSLSVSRDFGDDPLSLSTTFTARWQRDLPLGGLAIRLDGRPGERDAATVLNWSLEW